MMIGKYKNKSVGADDPVGAPLQRTSRPQDLPEGWEWKTLGEEFSLLSSVGIFRLDKLISPKYIVHCLNSPTVRDKMLSEIAGVAITRLTLNKLNASVIPMPPLSEQVTIVEEIDRFFCR